MAVLGKDIIVTTDIGGSQAAVAACKSCSLDVSQDFIESCSPNSGRTNKKIPTKYGWSVSCDCLVVNPQYALAFLEALKGGIELTLQFIALGFKQVGKAYVKSWKNNGPTGSLASLNVTFEGSEELTTNNDWDFINGTLYTYGNFADGTLNTGGYVINGTLQKDEPEQEQEQEQ